MKKHSSRMRTTPLSTVRASAATILYSEVPSLTGTVGESGGKRDGLGPGGSLYSEIQGIMGNGLIELPVNRLTHPTENITFSQLRWWAVNIRSRCVRQLRTSVAYVYIAWRLSFLYSKHDGSFSRQKVCQIPNGLLV